MAPGVRHMANSYTRKVLYLFDAGGETWAVTDFTATTITFEETRKNGQEDCHRRGEARLSADGEWSLFIANAEDGDEEAVCAFFDEHGPPGAPAQQCPADAASPAQAA